MGFSSFLRDMYLFNWLFKRRKQGKHPVHHYHEDATLNKPKSASKDCRDDEDNGKCHYPDKCHYMGDDFIQQDLYDTIDDDLDDEVTYDDDL